MMTAPTTRTSAVLAAVIYLAMTLVAPAMAKSALTDRDGVLQYVPDDSPYVFASGEPVPDKVMDVLEPRIDGVLKAYQVFFRELLRDAIVTNSAEKSPEEIERLAAVADELLTLVSIEGMRNAGFERDAGIVLYGHGLSPVLRIELADVKKFEALLGRLEAAAGESLKIAELGGESYRFIGGEEARVIVGVFDGNAVFAIAPTSLDEKGLKQLLGLTPPQQNIARSGKLLALIEEYGFSEHYVGYIDVPRLAQPFIGKATGIDAAVFALKDFDPATLSDVCKAEIAEVIAIAPRMVVGYGEFSVDAIEGAAILELRSDIAAGLKPLAAAVPGIGLDPGGLLSLAMSIDVPAAIAFAEARLTAIEDDPYECEHFAELQAGVASARAQLAQPLPPFITGMRGFNLIVESLGDYDMTSGVPPEKVDASLVIAMDDAPTMFMMGAMMIPDLAAVDLQADGIPVPLAVPQLQSFAESSYAAMTDSALAISMGSDAKSRVTTVLTAKSAQPPPLMSSAIDAGAYYEFMAENSLSDGEGEESPMPEAAQIALRDATLKVGELYDRISFDVRITDKGIEVRSTTTLKK